MTEKVVDAIVQSIINETLKDQPVVPGKTIVDRVGPAFRSLQSRRQEVDPLNINLAAAEHYMYARLLAGMTGDPMVKLAPTLYGAKKRLYFALGIEAKMAATDQPVLRPSNAVERWGTLGATQGLKDYTQATGQAAHQYGKAVSKLMTEATRYKMNGRAS